MGSVRERDGKYIAEAIGPDGKRKSKSHPNKKAAWAWVLAKEEELSAGELPNKTLYDLLEKYAREVTPHKKSRVREANRIAALQRDKLAKCRLGDLKAPVISDWKARELATKKPNSVRRDWVVLSHACNIAVSDWHWLKSNPFKDVERPKKGAPRTRKITPEEVELILYTCGTGTLTGQVGICLLFALETAMRAGEICSLAWEHVHDKHVHIPKELSKNGEARDVPLSQKARELIKNQSGEDPVFGINASQLDSLWRKCRDRVMIKDLHFHDTRRTALTRLSRKMDVLALAKMSGHKDLAILQSVYYQPSIDDLADQLD